MHCVENKMKPNRSVVPCLLFVLLLAPVAATEPSGREQASRACSSCVAQCQGDVQCRSLCYRVKQAWCRLEGQPPGGDVCNCG